MRRDREWRLFLDLCAPLARGIVSLPTPPEWPRMLEILGLTRLEALAFHNLKARDLEDQVPAPVLEQLRAGHAWSLARYHLLGEMVAPHLEALSREVDFLVLKGTAWAHTVYPGPHLRQSGDIDLLVRAEDQDRAGRVLEERGFAGSWGCGTDHGSQFSLRRPSGGTVYLELHPCLGRPRDHPHVDTEQAWLRAEKAIIWGLPCRTPGSAVGIAHLAAQLASDIYCRPYLRYLIDLRYLARDPLLCVDSVSTLVTRGGLSGLAYCASALGEVSVPLPRPGIPARVATCMVGAAGYRVRTTMPVGLWAVCSRILALMLYDRGADRWRRVESYLEHSARRLAKLWP